MLIDKIVNSIQQVTAELGQAAIWLSVLSAIWGIVALSIGLRRRKPDYLQSGRNAVVATFILISVATGTLIFGFVTDDFSLRYVVEVSSAAQPLLYKITALWGKMSGSLLFWLWVLTFCGAIVVWQNRKAKDTLADYSLIPIVIVELFFIVLVTGLVQGIYNPLERFPNGLVAPDGQGMNPLLQTPSMAFHPPTLYVGWISLTVPFAFAVGSLASGRVSSEWILRSRRWTLFSWIVLTVGITLGGHWAYQELGWGGYWAWDPVENVSFLPWLLVTAFLHSVMIQEKRSMLKIWNILLITLAFQFTILGTYITRSGIIDSVHAFAQSDISWYFLGFILVSTAGVIGLVVYRWQRLKSANRLESLLSRESAFVLNNWLLVGLTLIILWGTLWPIVSEAIQDKKAAVPEAFFNQVVVIPGLLLLFLTGAGPIISWKKITPNNFRRMFLSPIFIGLIAAAVSLPILAFRASTADVSLDDAVVQVSNEVQVAETATTNIFADMWNFLTFGEKSIPVYSLLCIFASVFVLVAIFNEFYRGAKLRAKRQTTNLLKGLWLLILRNKRRYGGYIIHIGIVIVYIGIMGSKGYFQLESKSLQLGDSMTVGAYRFTLLDTYQENHGNYDRLGLIFDVEKDEKHVATMKPARHYYFTTGQGDTDTIESAIHSIGMNDLYIALGDIPPNIRNGGYVNVQIYHNPLIKLVWIGIAAMVIGGLVAIAEKQEYKPRPATA
ncbi:heme lyase CcmF/NrfE family subunit [Candidatus Poribacteria bacterium]|nr:heme lyase CcmF/NrfE family subunit [Candidatus Poribacteria bacterium]MYB65849.1 heme lyase CcmF/NrfE family subunit [Candidatus Poribacteria bacterium]MYF54971.1 heme lyase CcmF/NrfE family subunit [Candidatus Poribacteria bacterium]MYI94667.1 heme lyase CcmF/NrfE family subunit [Candidatus Poribacteria bacterium]